MLNVMGHRPRILSLSPYPLSPSAEPESGGHFLREGRWREKWAQRWERGRREEEGPRGVEHPAYDTGTLASWDPPTFMVLFGLMSYWVPTPINMSGP